MDFLVINNDLCAGCKLCVGVCPHNAMSVVDKRAVIDSTRCKVCGSCFKKCPSNAIKIAFPVQKITQALAEKEYNDELKVFNDRLVSENKILTDEIRLQQNKFTTLVSKLNEAIVVVDRSGKITTTNKHFIDMLDSESRENYLNRESLIGREFRGIVQPLFYRHFMYVQNSGRDSLSITTQIGKTSVSASIHPVRKGDFAIIIFRNMTQLDIVNDETRKRIESVIELNMSMVQKIGFLLGEEVSQTSNLLRQTIKCLNIPSQEEEAKDE